MANQNAYSCYKIVVCLFTLNFSTAAKDPDPYFVISESAIFDLTKVDSESYSRRASS